MSLRSQFAVDASKEQEGVEVQYAPNKDKSIPSFVISRASKANKAYSKALEKATRPYRKQIDMGTMDNDVAEGIFKRVFVQTVLKGWSNVELDDGVKLDFTEDNAIRLFEELPELYDDLREKANGAALFRDEKQEEEAGN